MGKTKDRIDTTVKLAVLDWLYPFSLQSGQLINAKTTIEHWCGLQTDLFTAGLSLFAHERVLSLA
jgi:hypothetical protein